MKDSNMKFVKSIIACIGIITILFSVIRCFLGADLTDEALYIGDPLMVVRGSTPYVNNWLQTPGFSFFLAPIVGLYDLLVPTHQGIFLFMRFFFLLVKVLLYIMICVLFRDTRYKHAVMLVALPLVSNFFGMIPAVNYTNIPLMGTLLAGILLLYQWQFKQNEKVLPVINGVILACSTLCSPTQILNCVIFLLFYLFCVNKKAALRYMFGGVGTALFFSAYMIAKAGSLSDFIYSLETLLNHPYFSFGSSTLSWQAYNIFPLAIGSVVLYVVCVLTMELLRRWKGKENSFVWSCKIGLAIGAFVGMIFNLIQYDQYPLWNREIILLSIGSFFYRFLPANKEVHKLFDFVAIPEMATFFGMALTVYGGAANRFYVFVPMALICILYIYDVLKEQVGEYGFYLAAVYICLFMIVMVKYQAQTIYGEFDDAGQFLPAKELDTQVKEGVYAGIFTTEKKAMALQELEICIRQNTNADEYVLFLDRAPMAYMMTEARPCSSTSWDPQLYCEGFRGDTTMLQDYFATVGRTPDKVIYIQTGSKELISIEQDDYVFNEYIDENYFLRESEVIADVYKVLTYSKK